MVTRFRAPLQVMSQDKDRLDPIFSEALAKTSPEERERYLASACAGNPELRRAVDSLIEAHEQAGEFLRRPLLSSADSPSAAEGAGAVIGRYKLLEQIGEGGFGLVFMAEQQEPVRRLVALKIIKAGMDSKEVVARFEAERQALALMDHPNLARVLDGGTTPAGRPYFVMDLVKGTPITEFCDHNQLPTEARLRLFLQVCAGVQHAHQKGIIHRDLKPSNVLVTVSSGEPAAKIIDFGIAKAIGQKLTERTLFTRFEQLIGTPAYMSPEQAEWGGKDIDTRSDIYSLGVMLYELLTGTTPFEKEILARAALDEVRRMIRETEAPTPSLRLRALGPRLQEIARQRQTDPGLLTRLLRGDLDWIVSKCLEKERGRRYESAGELASDLQRHLRGDVVLARAPGKLYRFRKVVRRNKLLFAAGGVVVTSLILGLGAATWMLLTERQAKREQTRLRALADARQQHAQAEALQAQELAKVLTDMLKGAGPEVARGRDTTILREIVDQTAAKVGQQLTNQPEVQVEALGTVAAVYQDLELYKQMEGVAQQRLAIARANFGENSPYYADALGGLGRALGDVGQTEQSEAYLRRAVLLQSKLSGVSDSRTAELRDELGELLISRGKWPEAESLYRELLALQPKTGMDRAELYNNLSVVLKREGRLTEAEKLSREAVALSHEARNPSLEGLTYEYNLATQMSEQQRLADAEAAYREALALSRQLWGNDNSKLAPTALSLVELLAGEKKYADADKLFDELLDPHASRQPQDYSLLAGRADYLAHRGLWKQAVTNLCEAMLLDPGRARGSLILADVLAGNGEPAAYRLLQKLDTNSPPEGPFSTLAPTSGRAAWQTIDNTNAVPGLNARALAIAAGPDPGSLACAGYASIDTKGREAMMVRTSRNSGKTWATADQWVPGAWPIAVASGLCVASNGLLFVGGDVCDGPSRRATLNWAVRRSTDGGATWTVQDLVDSGSGGKAKCFAVQVAPWGEIYAAGQTSTNQGAGGWVWLVRKSSDGGATWRTVDSSWDQQARQAWAIAFAGTDTVYVAGNMSGTFGTKNGEVWVVRRSSDRGATWATVDTFQEAPGLPAEADGVAVDSAGAVYVAGMARGRAAGGGTFTDQWVVRRSLDGGQTWSSIDDLPLDLKGGGVSWDLSGPTGITIAPSGALLVCGCMLNPDNSLRWVVRQGRRGTNGAVAWSTLDNFQLAHGQSARANSIVTGAQGNIYVAGRAADAAGVEHWLIRRLGQESVAVLRSVPEPERRASMNGPVGKTGVGD
jgi:tetratricopeptide (TPR) repeat protein